VNVVTIQSLVMQYGTWDLPVSAATVQQKAIKDFEQNTFQTQTQVHENLAAFGDKMVERAMRKGKSNYQFKVGDEVLILRDINDTKKSLSKKPKFASPFLESPAEIVEILQNNSFRLKMVNGSVLPHNRNTFTSSMIKIWRKNPNPPIRQQPTVRDILPSAIDLHADDSSEDFDEEETSETAPPTGDKEELPNDSPTDENSSALNAEIPLKVPRKRSLFSQMARLEKEARYSKAPRQKRQRKQRPDDDFVRN
jgi:hypothetical protein